MNHSKFQLSYFNSYLSCPEKDDNDSDSTENTLKLNLGRLHNASVIPPKKSCLKKLSSIDEQSSKGKHVITPESSYKPSSGNKSNRISLKFVEEVNQDCDIKGFSLDCTSLHKKTSSSEMELNPSHGMRSHLSNKQQPKSQIIPFKIPKNDFILEDDFILEEDEDDELKLSRSKTEISKKPGRSKSSSSILEKLKEKTLKFAGDESD